MPAASIKDREVNARFHRQIERDDRRRVERIGKVLMEHVYPTARYERHGRRNRIIRTQNAEAGRAGGEHEDDFVGEVVLGTRLTIDRLRKDQRAGSKRDGRRG